MREMGRFEGREGREGEREGERELEEGMNGRKGKREREREDGLSNSQSFISTPRRGKLTIVGFFSSTKLFFVNRLV